MFNASLPDLCVYIFKKMHCQPHEYKTITYKCSKQNDIQIL